MVYTLLGINGTLQTMLLNENNAHHTSTTSTATPFALICYKFYSLHVNLYGV